MPSFSIDSLMSAGKLCRLYELYGVSDQRKVFQAKRKSRMCGRSVTLFLPLLLCLLPLGSTSARAQAVGVQPIPAVTATRSVRKPIAVMGQVTRPGVYEVPSATPQLVDVIWQAGGLTTNASGNIHIVRNGRADQQTFYSPCLKYTLLPGDLVVVDARRGRGNGMPAVFLRPKAGARPRQSKTPAKSAKPVGGHRRDPRAFTRGLSHKITSGDGSKSKTSARTPTVLIGALIVLAGCGMLWSAALLGRSPRVKLVAKTPARLPNVPTDEALSLTEEPLRLEFDGLKLGVRKARVDEASSSASSASEKQSRLLDRVLSSVQSPEGP